MATFSERLKEAMALHDIDQATLIRITGIDKGALSAYVHGRYKAGQTNLYLLAKALNVNEAWLMGHDVPMARPAMPDSLSSSQKEQLEKIFNSLSAESQRQALDYMRFLSTLEQKEK